MMLTEDILLGLDEAVVSATAKGVPDLRVQVEVVHELVVAARETLRHHAFMDDATPGEKVLIGLASLVVCNLDRSLLREGPSGIVPETTKEVEDAS